MCATKKTSSVFLFIILMLASVCHDVYAKDAFTFDVKDNSGLTVTTSKRLHYGVLSRSDYNGDPDYETLFFKTLMIEPQEGFFDISKAGTNESVTRASTDLGFGGNFYTPSDGLSREYLLYTEFDRLSKPALFNYLTVGNIAIRIIAKNNKLPKKLNEKISKILDAADKVEEVALSALEVANAIHKTMEIIVEYGEIPEGSDIEQQVKGLGEAIETMEQLLGVLAGADNTSFYDKLKNSPRFRGGHVGTNALYKRILKLLSGDMKNADKHLAKIVENKTLKKTITEVLIETVLQPFCHDGKFYFPKRGNYLKEYSKISSELKPYDHVRLEDVAHDFARLLHEEQIERVTERVIRLSSKGIAFTGGVKILSALQDVTADMENLKKTLEFTKNLKEGVSNLDLTAEDIFTMCDIRECN